MNTVLILGTPAAGKSSVARALLKRCERGVHIAVDDLRHMVVTGLLEPAAEMTAAHLEQLRLARETASQMAARYADAGFVVVIDDFWLPENPELGFEALSAHKVVLFPSLETTLQRLQQRNPGEGDFKSHLEFAVRLLHPSIAAHAKHGWQVVDSSRQSVEETALEILALQR
jgi:predicted kinase